MTRSELIYIYQGITGDERYYVLAMFPIAAEALPEEDAESDDGYNPESFESYESNQRAYRAYLERVQRRLESMPSTGYTPNPVVLEKMIKSLRVSPTE